MSSACTTAQCTAQATPLSTQHRALVHFRPFTVAWTRGGGGEPSGPHSVPSASRGHRNPETAPRTPLRSCSRGFEPGTSGSDVRRMTAGQRDLFARGWSCWHEGEEMGRGPVWQTAPATFL